MTRLLHDHAGTGLCAVAPSGRVLGASGLFLRALGLAALPPDAMLHDLLPLADGCPPCAGWHWLIEPSPSRHHPASLPNPHEMQGDARPAPAPSGQRPTPAPALGGVLVRTLAMEEARAIPGCPDLRDAAGAPAGQAASAARMGVLLQLFAPDLPLLPDLPGVPASLAPPAPGPLQPGRVADAPQPAHAPDPSHVHPAAPPATPNAHLRQALDALSVGLGHDFGNVVASVLGFAEIAISRLHAAPRRVDDPHPAVDPMVVRSLDNIVLGCQRAKEVIAFAQSIAGRVDLTAEPADLRPLVTAWCAELAGELPPEARWAVSCGLPAQKTSSENPAPDRADADRLPLVRVDAARLREAFAEIWRNAAWSVQAGQAGQAGQSGQPGQTTTQGHHAAAAAPVSAPASHPAADPHAPAALRGDDQTGRILVETALVPPSPRLPGRWLRVRVRDTGRGMDADTLCRMRDPYFSTKARHEGKGRGLARAAGIVRAHGGRLDVAAGPGLGCMVDILLPVPDGA